MTNTTLDELTIRGYEKEEMMKAKISAGGLSNFIDIKEPYEELTMTLPVGQNVFNNSVEWSNVDSIVFKLSHVASLDGEDIAIYNYHRPQLAIRNDERVIKLEKRERELTERVNELSAKLYRYENADE